MTPSLWWSGGRWQFICHRQTVATFGSWWVQHQTVGDSILQIHAMMPKVLISEFTMMLGPLYSFNSNGPNSTAKQMEKIAVTQGPIIFRLHLFQGLAQETASCGGCVRSWKETSAALRISHHYSGWIKRGTLWSNKRKVREEERVNEKLKPAVWKCLIFTTVQWRLLITVFRFGHNQTLNLP